MSTKERGRPRSGIASARPSRPAVEEWCAIVGWEQFYEVSSLGRIRRIATGRILKPIDRGAKVQLSQPGLIKTRWIGRMVARAFLPDFDEAKQVDHENGDRSVNIVSNLRMATQPQNAKNRRLNANNALGIKGVSFHRRRQRYVARIQVDGRRINIGEFRSSEDAARAYDAAEQQHYGQFARAKEARRAGP